MKPYLIPKLNYKFTLGDAIIGLKGFLESNTSDVPLKKIFNNENIRFTNHARTGLRIALNSLNLPSEARIGVQAFNCHTVFEAIHQAGFNPIFIDVTDNFQIDINDLQKKSDDIDALIVTHLFGIPAELDKVRRILPDKPIIEDCAHSYLSKYKNKLTGTIGDIGIFSIGKAKFPSIGEGGFIVVNNPKYIQLITKEYKALQDHRRLEEIKYLIQSILLNFLHNPFVYYFFTKPVLKKADKKYDLSGKYKFKEMKIMRINKALLMSKLKDLEKLKILNKMNAELILSNSQISPTIKNVIENQNYELNYFMLPYLVNSDREGVIRLYKERGIEVDGHFKNSILWAKQLGYQLGGCLNSEKIADNNVSFPTYIKIY